MRISKELSAALDGMEAAINKANEWLSKQPCAEGLEVHMEAVPGIATRNAWFVMAYDHSYLGGLIKALRVKDGLGEPDEYFAELESEYPVPILRLPVIERKKYFEEIPEFIRRVRLYSDDFPAEIDAATLAVQEALDAATGTQI